MKIWNTIKNYFNHIRGNENGATKSLLLTWNKSNILSTYNFMRFVRMKMFIFFLSFLLHTDPCTLFHVEKSACTRDNFKSMQTELMCMTFFTNWQMQNEFKMSVEVIYSVGCTKTRAVFVFFFLFSSAFQAIVDGI